MLIDPRQWQLGLAGYGEVSRILAQDMRDPGLAVAAFDLKFDAATDVPPMPPPMPMSTPIPLTRHRCPSMALNCQPATPRWPRAAIW